MGKNAELAAAGPADRAVGPIFVIEDDRDYREALAELLATFGYQVCAFATGREALAALATASPGLVLLDIHLQGENGLEVARAMRQTANGRAVPMISISGFYNGHEHASLLNLCGIRQCLVKPVDPYTLRQSVYEAVGSAPGSAG